MSLFSHLPARKNAGQRRVGRGYGSKKGGHTAGRGTKGQLSRGSNKIPLWFEGGQLPLVRRLPWWRGKGRLVSLKKQQEVQLKDILAKKMTKIDPQGLAEVGLIDNSKIPVKVIGAVEVNKKITLAGVGASQPVRQAIVSAGGSIEE